MLYTDPQMDPEAESEYTARWDIPNGGMDEESSAFHWGGLTAGSRWTAFWVFLAPFAIANTAGWMLRRRNKGTVLTVRFVGLTLTGLFASQLTTAAIALHGGFHVWGLEGSWLRLATGGLLVVVYAAVLSLVGWLSTQSHFNPLKWTCRWKLILAPGVKWMQPPRNKEKESDPDCQARPSSDFDWTDPTAPTPQEGRAWATDSRLWRPHSILHRLRRIHLGVAVGVITLVVARGGNYGDWLFWLGVAVVAIAVLTLIATTVAPEAALVRAVTGLIALVSLAAAAPLVIVAFSTEPPPAGGWTDVHDANLWLAIAYGVPAILTFVLQADRGSFRSIRGLLNTARTPGALALAAFFGSAMGIAVVTAVERSVAPGPDDPLTKALADQSLVANGAGWTAVWMFVMVLLTLVVGAVFSAIPLRRTNSIDADATIDLDEPANPEPPPRYMPLVYLRRVTGRVEGLLAVGFVVGIGSAIGLAIYGCDSAVRCDPARLQVDDWGIVSWLAAGAALVLIVRAFFIKRKWGLILTGVVAVVIGLGYAGWLDFQILTIDVNLTNLVDASLAVAVLIPSFYFFRSILSGLGDGEKRRQTGILWDVASFWPRYFHPLGPPAYGPSVISSLRKEVSRWPGPVNDRVDQGGRLILAAHSQGSFITAVALTQMGEDELAKLRGILTYGSPLGFIYGRLFEVTDLEGVVTEFTSGRGASIPWTNLYRNSDYLGGTKIGNGVTDESADGYGHSWYEVCQAYGDAVQRFRDPM